MPSEEHSESDKSFASIKKALFHVLYGAGQGKYFFLTLEISVHLFFERAVGQILNGDIGHCRSGGHGVVKRKITAAGNSECV